MTFKVKFKITILQASGLVAKDKNMFGKKTTSDPYIKISVPRGLPLKKHGKVTNQTAVVMKSVDPVWKDEAFLTSDYNDTHISKDTQSFFAELKIFDYDLASADDPMGTVYVPLLPNGIIEGTTTQWYPVEPKSAKNATGQVQVQIQVMVDQPVTLGKGSALSVSGLTVNNKIKVGLAWDMLGHKHVDLDASCVALLHDGQLSLENTVYYGNPTNANESIVHSGDEKSGDKKGDDESIFFHLDRLPPQVLALYIVLTVATPGMKLGQIKSAQFRVATVPSDETICVYKPADNALSENATAMFMVRIGRSAPNSNEWVIRPIEETHPTARDFGGLIPYLKSYTKDLVPNIRVNPTERVAIMRKNGNIRLADYCAGEQLPDPVTFGLAWDITGGQNIDLDASAICLDSDLNLVDEVWFKKLKSSDGSIVHHGDEREGDEHGDDEKMDIYLNKVSQRIQYIGFCINSYSGQELDDVARAFCHLFDSETKTDIASYALTNSAELDKHTALVMGCLYRGSSELAGDWCLCIISEAAHGRTVKDNVDELQNFLRRHPPQAPSHPQAEEISVAGDTYQMPAFVPYEEPTPAAAPTGGAAPKKMINVNGVTKLNPEVSCLVLAACCVCIVSNCVCPHVADVLFNFAVEKVESRASEVVVTAALLEFFSQLQVARFEM